MPGTMPGVVDGKQSALMDLTAALRSRYWKILSR